MTEILIKKNNTNEYFSLATPYSVSRLINAYALKSRALSAHTL